MPDHRILSVPPAIGNVYPNPHTDEVMARSSFIPVLALILAGPQVGMARGALNIAIEKAPRRAIAYTMYTAQTRVRRLPAADRGGRDARRDRGPARAQRRAEDRRGCRRRPTARVSRAREDPGEHGLCHHPGPEGHRNNPLGCRRIELRARPARSSGCGGTPRPPRDTRSSCPRSTPRSTARRCLASPTSSTSPR